jgi:hypothetical protein
VSQQEDIDMLGHVVHELTKMMMEGIDRDAGFTGRHVRDGRPFEARFG